MCRGSTRGDPKRPAAGECATAFLTAKRKRNVGRACECEVMYLERPPFALAGWMRGCRTPGDPLAIGRKGTDQSYPELEIAIIPSLKGNWHSLGALCGEQKEGEEKSAKGQSYR